ncbi:MAG: hypothetical protein AAFY03_06045, partial [Pseudomonadota bacterium]
SVGEHRVGFLERVAFLLKETYAMLSYGLCDMVPGHPRYVRAVGQPDFERAAMPRWLGMPRQIDPLTNVMADEHVGFVDVVAIEVTRGYMRSTIGLLYREEGEEPLGLSDLGARPLAFQQGTLAGAIAMVQMTPETRPLARHFNPSKGFLWDVENSGIDTALVDVALYDAHRKSNPATPLRLAAWRHPIGMDIGIAVVAENSGLKTAIDAALLEMEAAERFDALAKEEGLSYAAPKSDALAADLTLETIRRTR